MSDKKTYVPDPATTYERAKPHAQSPGGKIDQPKAKEAKEQDHLQEQNASPNAKNGQQQKKP